MLLDIALFVLFVAVVLWSAKRGLIVTTLRVAAWVVSFVLARMLGSMLAQPLYNAIAAPPIRNAIAANLDPVMQNDAVQSAQQLLVSIPNFFLQLAQRTGGVTQEYLLDNAATQPFDAQSAAYALEQSVIAPVGVAVFQFVLTLLGFVALMLICRLVVHKLAKVRKLPVIRQFDGVLGGVAGLLKGALLVAIAVLLVQLIAALANQDGAFVQQVDSSIVVSWLSWA
ncbi:MAG: CvpA family protein [Oscillospiraceae bacterium]|nr:CvpA family protein [Oscillospiraceae bacterium]